MPAPVVMRVALAACLCMLALTTVFAQTTLVSFPSDLRLEDPTSLDELQDIPVLGILDAGGDYTDVNFRIYAQNKDGSAQPFHQVLSCGNGATTNVYGDESYFLIPDEIDDGPPDCVLFGLNFDNDDAIDSEVYVQLDQPVTGLLMFIAPVGKYPFSMDDIVLSSDFEVLADGCTAADGTYAGSSCMPLTRAGPGQLHRAMSSRGVIRFLGPVSTLIAGHFSPCGAQFDFTLGLQKKIDCVQQPACEWSACDATCGSGSQNRTLYTVQAALNGGAPCLPPVQVQACPNLPECSSDCVVGDWGDFTACSASCGGGTRSQTRVIESPAVGAGAACPALTNTEQCNTFGCPVDCVLSDWSDWTVCSSTCGGGMQTRTRSVVTDSANGGVDCGILVDQRVCNSADCPVDCAQSDWGVFGECSATCGAGTQTATRVTLTFPENGGAQCGPETTTQACNNGPCPVDCQVSDWSDFGDCSATCGGGDKTRTRTITVQPANGGAECPALTDTDDCNYTPCPVDCVGSWSAWSSCSASCAGGVSTRTFQIVTPAANNGAACPDGVQQQPCNTQLCPVDCVMSDWSDFSQCSASCGGGTQTHTRTITTAPANGGAQCLPTQETVPCNTVACPVDCQMGPWSAWSTCPVQCGGGLSTRTRSVAVAPANGGAVCDVASETQPCNTQVCDVNCVQTPWSSFSACDAPCGGGNQVRTRTTVTPAAGNGVACGPTVDTAKCNTQACAVDCQMSEYGPWSLCSSSCGGGLQTRVRSVLVPSASGGASCPCTTDTQQCNTAACPVDCVVSAWSDPSSCSASCGGGTATRTRVVIVQPANNGASCPPLQAVDQCNTQTCPTDCAMNPWSPWSDCSQTCGGGVQTRSRSVNVPAANGGLACPSDLTAQQTCNTQGCPVDCVMSDWTTDGVCSAQCGTGVQTWTRTVLTAPQNGGQTCGPTSRSDPCNTQDCPTNCVVSEWSDFGTCSASCGGGVYTRTRSITAQPTNGGNKCPSDLSDTQPCNTQGCAVDCAVGDWGAWSTCSATCGSGTQQRTRAVVTAAANGGKVCPPLTDFQTCNTQKCAIDCKMSDWHDWGSCSKKCGGGLILRTRSISQFPSCGGAKCGSLIEIDKCNTQPCDVDCQMGDWTAWGKCSATCGGGTQTRTRGVQRSQCGKGASCPTQTDTRSCNTNACPQDCAQGPWSDWGACSATCGGGSQTRTRVVTGQPKGCGKSCGSSSETRRCGTGACPKDCQMGDWTAWGKCSKECGGGVQIRSRSVKQQKCGKGAQCPNIYDQQPCNTQACVQPKVDCQVSAWGAWSQCSASCGGGTKTHTRTVITPASNGGAVCPALTESALCNSDACPVDCAMNPFGPWSQCSKTCGGGVQTRTRSVKRAQCGKGASCPATSEQQACNTAPCDAECQVSDWSNWGSCSKSCGTGTQTRTRKITQAQCGKGKQCPALSDTQYCNTQACDADCTVSDFGPWSTCSKSCGGGTQTRSRKVVAEKCGKGASCPGLSETQKCNTQTCVTDCKVSDWGCWGSCSKSCGTGVQTRSRTVLQQPSTGGAACPALTDQQTCNTGACKQDCVVSAWSSFGTCSKSCGTGQQTRTRTVLIPAANGGAACPALTDSTCCNTQSCKQDCQVSDFGSWSQCSQSCGGGVQTRSRTVTVKAANGGASCPCLTDTQKCNTQSCSKDCQVSDWTQWTTCSKSCGGGWTYQYRTITQQPSCGGGKCPALLAYKACNTQACAVDCKLTDWSSWGQCSKTCGSGVQTRKRSIVTYSCGGGSSCPASTELQQSQACNTAPCASDCVVSPWGQWSQCSKTCGGGVTTQTRTVISPAVGCGSTCPALSQSNSCNTQPCKQDCQVSAWSPFGACSVGCGGGTQTRTRTVTLPALGGGAACPALTDSTTCNAQPCPAGGTCNYGVTAYTVSTAGVAVNFANGIDSIDVNIRISYNNGQLATLNFHPNTGCSKGSQMVFNHLTHPNFPKSCSGGAYSIVWVQVNGNNCHWGEQKEQPICGTVPQSCAWVYNAWGSCSNQCGSGTQSRTAVCQTASGASCDVSKCGPSVLTQSCSSNAACGVGCSATSCSGDGSSSTVSFAVGNAGVLAISLQFAQPTYGDLRGFFLDFPSTSRLSSQCAKCQLTGSSVTAFERNTKTMGCDSSVSLQGCSGPSSYDLVAAIGSNAVLKDDIRSTTVYLACSGLTLTLDDVKGASVGVRSIWVGNNALLRLQTTKQTCIVGNQ